MGNPSQSYGASPAI